VNFCARISLVAQHFSTLQAFSRNKRIAVAYSRRRTSLKRQNRRRLLNGCESLEPRQLLATTPVNDFIWDYNILLRFDSDATAA
jgi:hypothetical protein